ncbi:MAG: SDR family oxidoreductase [Verrucomicrobiia bacterium]|jgi:NAD(P)-dependent dehydrogenase (short-subunit alcohol dehydrogenase family)
MTNRRLMGRTALVSGSTAGIGYAIALGLAREGAWVWVNGRTQARVDAAIRNIRKEMPDATLEGVAEDLGTATGCEQLVRRVPSVDVLVNNLGIFEPKPFETIPDADWLRLFEVNVMSGVRLSRAYLPGMKQRNWGRIVFISSESAVHIPAEMVHYGMTKTAQVAVARGIAEGCAGTNVTVNSVLAGPTASEGVTNFVNDLARKQNVTPAELEKQFFMNVRPTSLLKRFLKPEEVASVVVYVCSPEASAVNGAAIRAEGGVVKAVL